MYQRIRKIVIALTLFLGAWLGLRWFVPLFLPFLLGLALALAAEPLVAFLSGRLKLPRALSAGVGITAAFCLGTMACLLILALLLRELGILAGMLPDLEQAASQGMHRLSGWVLGLINRLPESIRQVLRRSAEQFFSGGSQMLDQGFRFAVDLAGGVLSHVPDSALILGTGIISSYMISAKLPRIKAWLCSRISRERLRRYAAAARRLRGALFGWLRAQVKLMGITWLILTMGFVLLRIPYAPLWAAVVSLVDVFPVLGVGTVLLPWVLVCLLLDQTARAVGLLGVYAVVSLVRSAMEPRLVGQQLGLDPLVTLAAVYAGYRLWGIGGMILAPVLTVATVQVFRAQEQER